MVPAHEEGSFDIENPSLRAQIEGTGFEPDHVDEPPSKQERARYDPSLPLDQRLFYAIQEYRVRRRFNGQQTKVLSKYLRFAGLEMGKLGRLYGDKLADDDGNASGEEAAGPDQDYILADEHLYDRVVAPEEAVACFLSDWLVQRSLNLDLRFMNTACEVVSNLFDFILKRNVAPELIKEVTIATELAGKARKELNGIYRLGDTLPTPVHRALNAILFPGPTLPEPDPSQKQLEAPPKDGIDAIGWTHATMQTIMEEHREVLEAYITPYKSVDVKLRRMIKGTSRRVTKLDTEALTVEFGPHQPEDELRPTIVEYCGILKPTLLSEPIELEVTKEALQHLSVGLLIEADFGEVTVADRTFWFMSSWLYRVRPSYFVELKGQFFDREAGEGED